MTSPSNKGQGHNATISDLTPFIFASFPTEIVRLVFEVLITPGLRAHDEQQRQRIAYVFCLVSKDVKAWVEPLLYEKVILQSDEQVMSFLRALKIKPATFLARAVKIVRILNEELPRGTVDQIHIVFSRCPLLERFTIIGSCMRILQNIPKPQSGPYVLQELTIIKASSVVAGKFTLPHITLQRLQIINCSSIFLVNLFRRALNDRVLLDTLRAIPHIYLDFTAIPCLIMSSLIKSRAIPLWINPSPESISVLRVRASSDTPEQNTHSSTDDEDADRYREKSFSDVDSWIKYFDEDVQKCVGRLVVHTVSDTGVKNNPGASYIERCTAWIGLN